MFLYFTLSSFPTPPPLRGLNYPCELVEEKVNKDVGEVDKETEVEKSKTKGPDDNTQKHHLVFL